MMYEVPYAVIYNVAPAMTYAMMYIVTHAVMYAIIYAKIYGVAYVRIEMKSHKMPQEQSAVCMGNLGTTRAPYNWLECCCSSLVLSISALIMRYPCAHHKVHMHAS